MKLNRYFKDIEAKRDYLKKQKELILIYLNWCYSDNKSNFNITRIQELKFIFL